MKPSALLDESRIILGIPQSTPKPEVIRMLAERLLPGGNGGAAAVAAELLAREKLMTTGIGCGVAIPHAHNKGAGGPVAALAISPGGIEWDAIDGEPVHIILAFVTPEASPSLHVETLGETATLLGDNEVRAKTIAARSAGEILDIFRSNNG